MATPSIRTRNAEWNQDVRRLIEAASDYFEREVGEVLTVGNSHLIVLGPGRFFDLNERQIVMDGSTFR